MSQQNWDRFRNIAVQILQRKGQHDAAAILGSIPFTLMEAHNGFGDDFSVLHWDAPMEKYVELAELVAEGRRLVAYSQIAAAVSEIVNGYVRFVSVGLDTSLGPTAVAPPTLAITSDVVERALADAETLIRNSGATSGVDRVHTALHGYLRAVCDKAGIVYATGADITTLMKALLKSHPAFATTSDETDRIARAFGTIVDGLNPVRNHQSMAHANAALLPQSEAMLVINTVRTLLHYVDSKVR